MTDEIATQLGVFRHALASIAEEMGGTLERTAYSTNIKTRRDYTCAIFDADLRQITMYDIAPQHLASQVYAVPEIVSERKKDLEPGDALMINDPSVNMIHLPDVLLVSPLFNDTEEIIGYAANSAHHVDTGGSAPGGIPTDSTDLYQEGMIIPSIKAVNDWEFDQEIFDLIKRNVRVPRIRQGDSRAQLAANKIGEKRYLELHQEYGTETVETYIERILDYAEDRVRAGVIEIPDGTYEAEDFMDGDGIVDEPLRMKLTITVEDDELVVDFSGTASENKGPLNAHPSLTIGGVVTVLMSIIGGDIPKNSGIFRPFEFVMPEGTMINPSDDAAVGGVGEVAIRACELVTKALSDPIPNQVVAGCKGIVGNVAFGGRDPKTGENYAFFEAVGGGYGARPSKDGMDATQAHFQNTANSPVEEMESDLPVLIRRYELIEDSEGAGRHRGGLGIRRDYEFYENEASFSVLSDRTVTAPWGLFGGHEARKAKFCLYPDSPNEQDLGSKFTMDLGPGDIVSVQTPGGGGYGDPLERDPEDVLNDVVNGKITMSKAKDEYGVVIEPETQSVVKDETKSQRQALPDNKDSTKGDNI